MEKRQTKEWSVNAFNSETGEFVEAWNRSYDIVPDQQELQELLVQQAPAMKITPSKRKKTETDFDHTVATVGDIHFPFQNQEALDLAVVGLRALEPTQIHLLGDNLDNTNYSRFGTRKEWADSTQKGIDQYAEFLAKLRADHPDSKIKWHEGNHDLRTELRVREYNEDLLGIKRAGEEETVLSMGFILRLGELDIEYVQGYPSARDIIKDKHGDPQLEIYHGHVTGQGLAANKVIKTAFTSFNTGHTHNFGLVAKTFWVGDEQRTIYGAESGTFADPDITPSGKYSPDAQVRMDWHSGIIDWVVDEDGAIPGVSPINQHGITVRGKRIKS